VARRAKSDTRTLCEGWEQASHNGDLMLAVASDVDRGGSPGGGIDVGYRFGERPAVAAEVFGAVLPFPIGVIGRWLKDPGSAPRGLFMMAIRVFDAHMHGIRSAGSVASVGHDDGTVAEDELCAMPADPETLRKSERFAKPVTRLSHVSVGEHGDDRRGRNGPICDHV
jgi:hypothetical protein